LNRTEWNKIERKLWGGRRDSNAPKPITREQWERMIAIRDAKGCLGCVDGNPTDHRRECKNRPEEV
jgi:hypothetical protein